MYRLQNPYPINFMIKIAKIDTLFMTKMGEKNIYFKEYLLSPAPGPTASTDLVNYSWSWMTIKDVLDNLKKISSGILQTI